MVPSTGSGNDFFFLTGNVGLGWDFSWAGVRPAWRGGVAVAIAMEG